MPTALSSNIDDRTLHELYLWPFAESVRAGVASIMCSYQMVNNSWVDSLRSRLKHIALTAKVAATLVGTASL